MFPKSKQVGVNVFDRVLAGEVFLNSNAENSVKSIKSSWIHSATDSELSSCYFYERVEECENYITT